jgi:hypothetical protein
MTGEKEIGDICPFKDSPKYFIMFLDRETCFSVFPSIVGEHSIITLPAGHEGLCSIHVLLLEFRLNACEARQEAV